MTELLNSILVVNDCSVYDTNVLGIGILGGLIVIVLLAIIVRMLIVDGFSNIGTVIGIAIFAVLMAAFAALMFVVFSSKPIDIKMYIAANDIKVEQLSTYFDIKDISETNENTFMYIEPKEEYYSDVLNWYTNNLAKQ